MTSKIQLSEGKKLLISLSLFLVLLLTIDFGIGFMVVRRHGYFKNVDPISTENTITNQETFRRRDSICHHNLAPNQSRMEIWGDEYKIVTNSLGFKAATPEAVPFTSSKHRILFIGDSFTEGVGIPWDQTFIGIIGNALAPRNVEVFNAGVMGYCPKLEFYKILHLINDVGLHFDECVMFIDTSDVCDEIMYSPFVPANKLPEDEYTGRYTFVPNSLRWYEYSFIYRNLAQMVGKDPWKRFRILDNRTKDIFDFWNFRTQWSSNPRFFEKQGKPGIASCAYYVGLLKKLCESHGIKLSIAVYPWPKEVGAPGRDSIPRVYWRDYAAKNNLPFYDFFPFFDTGDSQQTTVAKYYIPKDVHWNAAGHAVIGKAWLEQYTKAADAGQPSSTR